MNGMTWSLAAIERNGADVAVALLQNGDIVSIDALPVGISPIDVVRQWAKFAPILQSWDPSTGRKITGARLVAPIRYPAKVICVGANYSEHRKEGGVDESSAGNASTPLLFFKPPTTTIVGPDDDVLIRSSDDNIDWEAEVGIVIGKGGRFIRPENALDHVAGYTLVNDISARALLRQSDRGHPALEYDWVLHKAQDTFCPTGPGMTPAWFIDSPGNIPFSLTVNGVEKQNGSTRDLIFDMRSIIVICSEYMTLEPGDIIATGTCGGVGLATGDYMADGDVVVVSSPLLGTLKNTIRNIKR